MTRPIQALETRSGRRPRRPAGGDPPDVVDRELSWLDFNGRVLQEGADPTVPLFDRLAFLGIFASNLDEFFRVRVASLRSLLRLGRKKVKRLSLDPAELLGAIQDVVAGQQEWFRRIFQHEIVPALAEVGVVLTDGRTADRSLQDRIAAYFEREVRPGLEVTPLSTDAPGPELENDIVYLVVELFPAASVRVGRAEPDLALVRIPSPPVERFAAFPTGDRRTDVLFVDDVIRLHLAELFPERRVVGAWAFEVSRDAELYLDAEFEGDVVEAIRRSLRKRETGALTRFLYDPDMPVGVLRALERAYRLEVDDLFEGGRYPRLGDLVEFPRCGVDGHHEEPWPTSPHPVLSNADEVASAVAEADRLLHFPYQSFDHVVRFLTEAAEDPDVTSIRLTVYRVSRTSKVLAALIAAADEGKDVRVFVEAKARFDEESNLKWARRLEERGILTYYSLPDLKVHAKIALVARRSEGRLRRQAYLGTGNFNEETARFYTDFGLLTADPDLTGEVARVFRFLEGVDETPFFRHLLVAPFTMRKRFGDLIDRERARAVRGEPARIVMKLNGLEDPEMIRHLRAAAADGVEVRGIVRGICRWTPDEDRWEGRVELRSIVDRYLEHGRAWVFGVGDEAEVYVGSADWMFRNLSRRVEVVYPVRDAACRAEVLRVLELQLADNRKARLVTAGSALRRVDDDGPPIRAQEAIQGWLAARGRAGGDR